MLSNRTTPPNNGPLLYYYNVLTVRQCRDMSSVGLWCDDRNRIISFNADNNIKYVSFESCCYYTYYTRTVVRYSWDAWNNNNNRNKKEKNHPTRRVITIAVITVIIAMIVGEIIALIYLPRRRWRAGRVIRRSLADRLDGIPEPSSTFSNWCINPSTPLGGCQNNSYNTVQ